MCVKCVPSWLDVPLCVTTWALPVWEQVPACLLGRLYPYVCTVVSPWQGVCCLPPLGGLVMRGVEGLSSRSLSSLPHCYVSCLMPALWATFCLSASVWEKRDALSSPGDQKVGTEVKGFSLVTSWWWFLLSWEQSPVVFIISFLSVCGTGTLSN